MKFFSQVFGKSVKRKSRKNNKTKKCKRNRNIKSRHRKMRGGHCSSCKLF